MDKKKKIDSKEKQKKEELAFANPKQAVALLKRTFNKAKKEEKTKLAARKLGSFSCTLELRDEDGTWKVQVFSHIKDPTLVVYERSETTVVFSLLNDWTFTSHFYARNGELVVNSDLGRIGKKEPLIYSTPYASELPNWRSKESLLTLDFSGEESSHDQESNIKEQLKLCKEKNMKKYRSEAFASPFLHVLADFNAGLITKNTYFKVTVPNLWLTIDTGARDNVASGEIYYHMKNPKLYMSFGATTLDLLITIVDKDHSWVMAVKPGEILPTSKFSFRFKPHGSEGRVTFSFSETIGRGNSIFTGQME